MSFANFKSTNLSGFISNDIVQPILLLFFFVVLLHESHGDEAAKIHWGKEGIIGLKAMSLLIVLYYFPIFLWKGVREVYISHEQLVVANADSRNACQQKTRELDARNQKLSTDLEDRKRNIHPEDPAYEHIKVIFLTLVTFRRAIGDKTPCEIEITAPTDSGTSGPIIRQFADIATLASNCAVFGPMDARMDPTVEQEAVTGMEHGSLIIHTTNDQSGSLSVYDSLAPYVPLKRKFSMPKDKPKVLIWLQFGKDVQWIR